MSTRKKPPLPHPIAKAIQVVFSQGHTPRVHVDARRRDVTVPDHVRERWQARLVIDLDPSWPLRLEYLTEGVAVDLAFSGLVNRCVFGWDAIYVVLDRATGRGMVVEGHLPPHELPEELTYTSEAPHPVRKLEVVEARPKTAAPKADATSADATGTQEAQTKTPEAKLRTRKRANAQAGASAPASQSSEREGSSSSDERAKERRARFRVIDGGR